MSLDTRVLEIVKAALPAIQVEALTAFVNEAAEIAKSNKDRGIRVEALHKEIDELRVFKTRAAEVAEKKRNLEKKEETLNEREFAHKLRETELKCERDKVELVKHLFGLVFRNTTIRRHMHGSVPLPEGIIGYKDEESTVDKE